MRGKDSLASMTVLFVRITPACAGKSCRCWQRNPSPGDHPRVCGEKRGHGKLRRGVAGSPPRVRGKEAAAMGKACAEGITPACAGKRRQTSGPSAAREDHPRVCGEKLFYDGPGQGAQGSPPRVRGKAITSFTTPFNFGITPACAGKRRNGAGSREVLGDHPRVCGEKVWLRRYHLKQKGSPPRVRGKAE